MIFVPAGLIHDLSVIAAILRDGNTQRALQLLEVLLETMSAEAD